MADLFLLDTNILVHFIRSDALWQRLRREYALLLVEPTPQISIVSDGELRSLAHQFNWQTDNRSQMNFALSYFRRTTIDHPAILEAYAVIDAFSKRIGHAMGQNDVWIAATATAIGAKLLTTDRDYDPISPMFLDRIWIDPSKT